MNVIVISPPSPVVSVIEAKRHLRVEPDVLDDDDYISGLVAAATAWLDGPDGWLGRALGVQVLEWALSSWPCGEVKLPYPPLLSVSSIIYVDPDGSEQSVPVPDTLYFEGMPAIRGRAGDLRIRYRAGYGAASVSHPDAWVNAVPPPIKVAILMLVAQWYESREATIIGSSAEEVPFGVKALVNPYRVY